MVADLSLKHIWVNMSSHNMITSYIECLYHFLFFWTIWFANLKTIPLRFVFFMERWFFLRINSYMYSSVLEIKSQPYMVKRFRLISWFWVALLKEQGILICICNHGGCKVRRRVIALLGKFTVEVTWNLAGQIIGFAAMPGYPCFFTYGFIPLYSKAMMINI